MKKRRAIVAAATAVMSLVVTSTLTTPALAWVGGAGHIYVNQSWDGEIVELDVEGSDSIENVRQKIYDKKQINPAATCLIFSGEVLQDEHVIDDYSIEQNDELSLYMLPVVAAWSITPEEHFVGNTVHNFSVTSPQGTHFDVVDGALPAEVTLDETTGIVDGKFTSSDPFDVTIRVTTLCGDADITWASSGATALPDTGFSETALLGGVAIAFLLATVGLALVVIRRRRARTN